MKKRLLSLMLVFAMVLGMVPMTALATDETGGYEGADSVTVTLSLSRDDQFMVGPGTDEVMAFKEITVPYFDLANYDLQEYYFVSESYGDDGDGAPGSDLRPGTPEYAEGKVTLLHLYIYALERFYCGVDHEDAGQGYLYDAGMIGTEVFTISGSVGSSFMNQFWGGDCNLNYYVNYQYPLASDGWGATCDQILLRDGDIITLGNFSNYAFYSDPTSIFNYIAAGKDKDTVHTTVAQGDEVTLTVYCAGPNLGTSYDTAQNIVTYLPDVYYTPVDDLVEDVTSWTYIGTADENGQIVFDTSDLEPGDYLVCVPGQPGQYYPDEICSTPGGIILTVECNHQGGAATCQEKAVCEVCFESYGELGDHSVDTENWIAENGQHFHKCTVTGCDYKEDRDDCSGGTATCQEKAVCDLCGESYGDFGDHAVDEETWITEDGQHFHKCTVTGCDYKEDREACSGGTATCQEKAVCDTCGKAYGVFADCVYDQLVVKNDYLASAATCTDDAVYYKSCVCGKQGSETFTVEDTALGHTWDGGVVTKKPTTGKEGVMTYTCTVCKDTYTESIARLPITPVGPSVSKPEEPEVPAEPEVTAPAYSDVKDEWFAAGVEFVTAKGLMNGVGDGKFGPNMNTSRGMIVTILWRLAGEPVPTAAAAFTDVIKGAYYEQGVAWAEQKGIVTGYGETFGPNDNITREQLAVMLYRYMGSPVVKGDLNAYSDGSQVSSYAVNAMIWAVQQGIFTGTGDGILAPQANATRAQVATILMRLLNK